MRFPEFSGEWGNQELQSIAPNISSGKDKPSNEGTVVLYGSTGIMGHTTSVSYKSEIVIVARVGANAGQLQLVDIPCGVTDNALVVNAKSWNKYIFYYLQHFNLNKLVFGSGQPLITGGMLKKIKIWAGDNVERNKIVHLLSLMDERIDTQKKIIEDLKKLKDAISISLFKSLCEKEYTIGDLCKSISAKRHIVQDITTNGSYPIIQQGENPIAGYTEAIPFMDYKKVILFGDHTLSIYRPKAPFLTSTDGIKILKPTDMVTRDYFYYLLYAFMPEPEGYKRHYSIVKKISVPVPNSNTQKSIVDKLLSIDSKVEIEARILELQLQQKQYLLSQTFI